MTQQRLEKQSVVDKSEIVTLKQTVKERDEACSSLSNILAKSDSNLVLSKESLSFLRKSLEEQKQNSEILRNENDASKLTISKLGLEKNQLQNTVKNLKDSIFVLAGEKLELKNKVSSQGLEIQRNKENEELLNVFIVLNPGIYCGIEKAF